MKTKLAISFLLGLLTLAFVSIKEPSVNNTPAANTTIEAGGMPHNLIKANPPVLNNIHPDFLIGAMTDGWKTNGISNGYSVLRDTLGFNMWHRYIDGGMVNGQFQIYGWTGSDVLNAPINDYKADIWDILDESETNGMRTLMERPKTTRLAFGQRSDYECEATNIEPNLWFYSYTGHNSFHSDVYDNHPTYGSNSWVRKCSMPISGPGSAAWVVTGLKANREQVNMTERWEGDKSYGWIVKPKIRADKDYIDNHDDEEICRIDVLNYDGNLIKSTVLRARNFKDQFNQYDGKYKEEFRFTGSDSDLTFIQTEAENFNPIQTNGKYRSWFVPAGECDVDFKVYWYGNCDMWIDYVRVDNDVANDLFGIGAQHDIYMDWLTWEATDIARHSASPLKFYIEEFEFNNLPCMAYVSRKLRDVNPNIGLMCDLNYSNYNAGIPFSDWNHVHENYVGAEHIKRFLIDSLGSTEIFMGSYPLSGGNGSDRFERTPIPVTLCGTQTWDWSTGMLAESVPVSAYEDTLQAHFDNNQHKYWSYREWTARADSLSKMADIPFINIFQTHLWYSEGHKLREPSNEEMDLMANLAVSWGARGIFYFWHEGWGCLPSTNSGYTYGRGLTNPIPCNTPSPFEMMNNPHTTTYDARTENVYGQNKWQKIIDMNTRLKTWGPTLMSFDNINRKTCIYRLAEERNPFLTNSYIYGLYTFKPGSGEIPCVQDFPEEMTMPEGYIGECVQDRYLQVATFKGPSNDFNKYFMIVNRRCSPFINESSESNNGGRRLIKAQFNPNSQELAGYDNWTITEIGSFNAPIEYNKVNMPPVNLGFFMPGEGKLYKMAPTTRIGGNLAGDENITGQSFTCEAPVYNNGYNITIGANTTIHFNDSSKFVMNGGVFTVGDQNTSAPQNITSDAVPGGSWRGHSFTNCEVKIYGATFTGLANDTTYAVNIIDCPVVDIRNCTFNTNSSLKGGVNAICFNNPFIAINNIYIGSNTFNSSGSTIPSVNVSSYAGVTTPLIIENNTFNEGNTAVFLSGIIGGAIKGNTITDNYIGINALTSSIDIVQNTITSTVSGSMGIFAAGGSELKLNSSGAFTLGGLNNISNEGTGTNNINVDGSYFLLEGGENIFNISSDQTSYHLYGHFPMFTAVTTEETNNCFKVNSSPVDPPINMVTSGYQGSQITFNFNPYLTGCEIPDGGDGLAINLGDGIYDTIYTGGSGSGGSQSSVASVRRTDKQAYVAPTAKTKYDSVSVLMRYRNYTQAKTKCLDLINTYPDSIQSIFAVSKLFLATVASDTSYNAANTLKIFYENLILNHPGNTSLVKRANYYILKCKVRMREYSQALAGFQQIINQNPYSYEGLIARWDYMATSLLVQGQGGAYSSIDNEQLTMNNYDIDGNDDDKKPFTKEQRQDIRKSINTAIEISKSDDEVKIKKLEEKSELGDVNASKELTQMKSLKQVVKTEKPKSIIEHVRIVSEDIRKVFGSNTSSKGNEPKNIPLVFRLSQNYPNPFNPVTKINYDLPKDSKVKIVIYDILGREVKRLVNNELKTAGSYIVDFNASNYASGVYFYRIEAEEPNGSKFVDSKKMVLLK